MSDELLVRMKTAVGAGQMIKALDEGAAEIERLRALLREARGKLVFSPLLKPLEKRIDAVLKETA